MTTGTKILVGALATTAAAWFLNGPMGFGKNCATGAAPAAPVVATAEQITACQTTVDGQINGKTINFTTGSATIDPASMDLVKSLATAIKNCAGTVVEVAGHTDQRGNDAANMTLSQNRANAVVKAMTDQGVPADRLIAHGYGETKPVDTSGTAAGDAKNRRIEFHVAAAGAIPAAAAAVDNAATAAADATAAGANAVAAAAGATVNAAANVANAH